MLTGHLDHRIYLSGAVPDLATIFDRVRLTVAPLRFGAGIKGKVLESFAAGVPCVITQVAAEGLPLAADLLGLVAETSESIAELICELHTSASRNRAAGLAGCGLIATEFSFTRVVGDLRTATKPTRFSSERTRTGAPSGGCGSPGTRQSRR